MSANRKSSNSKNKPCIEVSGVHFKYGDIAVLEDISFTVNEGEYIGIIGPNGGGKTTLLKLILGLLKPTKGTIKIHGQKVEELKDRSFIGYVPQRASQANTDFPATVEEIVSSGRTPKAGFLNHFTAHDREKIDWAMEIADVTSFKNKLIGELSGGQRQRVYIARALAGDPEILFLDEPTVAIDVTQSNKFYEFLREINKKMGITIMFISHDIECVAKEVSSVLCVNKHLVCHTSTKDLYTKGHLEKLYGKKITPVHHHHHHE
ncbi:MAG: metal ABC transporter ATP-binding protein [Candidatus Gracilibacteria bacterium]|nr:metal ABC transporter ATP-binding protein [Candidatus Peregrinibacteria bacterium]